LSFGKEGVAGCMTELSMRRKRRIGSLKD